MASGTALRSKIDRVLRNLHANVADVYLRVVTVTGGNARLGLGGTTTTVDTLVDPPPVMTRVATADIAVSGGLFQMGDYECILPGATDEDDIKTSFLVYGDDQYRIIRYEPIALGNVVVAWKVWARSLAPATT